MAVSGRGRGAGRGLSCAEKKRTIGRKECELASVLRNGLGKYCLRMRLCIAENLADMRSKNSEILAQKVFSWIKEKLKP